jgi:hypothetical protein
MGLYGTVKSAKLPQNRTPEIRKENQGFWCLINRLE